MLLGPFAGLFGANTAWPNICPNCLGPYSLCLGLAQTLLGLDLRAYPYIYHMEQTDSISVNTSVQPHRQLQLVLLLKERSIVTPVWHTQHLMSKCVLLIHSIDQWSLASSGPYTRAIWYQVIIGVLPMTTNQSRAEIRPNIFCTCNSTSAAVAHHTLPIHSMLYVSMMISEL